MQIILNPLQIAMLYKLIFFNQLQLSSEQPLQPLLPAYLCDRSLVNDDHNLAAGQLLLLSIKLKNIDVNILHEHILTDIDSARSSPIPIHSYVCIESQEWFGKAHNLRFTSAPVSLPPPPNLKHHPPKRKHPRQKCGFARRYIVEICEHTYCVLLDG